MRKLTRWVDRSLATALIILMAAMVLTVTWQVLTRFILRQPSDFTEELARFLLIWIGLLGASYALRNRAHLGIDLLASRLAGLRRQVLDTLVYGTIILFAVLVMIVGGVRLVQLAFALNQISAALGIRMGYVYLVIPLSGLLIIYYSIVSILQAISKRSILVKRQ
jgi:TRAP-type C4-dicarboxylate transport system permease small subunit